MHNGQAFNSKFEKKKVDFLEESYHNIEFSVMIETMFNSLIAFLSWILSVSCLSVS